MNNYSNLRGNVIATKISPLSSLRLDQTKPHRHHYVVGCGTLCHVLPGAGGHSEREASRLEVRLRATESLPSEDLPSLLPCTRGEQGATPAHAHDGNAVSA